MGRLGIAISLLVFFAACSSSSTNESSGSGGTQIGGGGTANGGTGAASGSGGKAGNGGGIGGGGGGTAGAASGGGGVAGSTGGSSGSGATGGSGASPSCQLDQPFGKPTPVDSLNSNADDGDLRYSADGSLAFFTRGSFLSGNVTDIWVASKANNFNDAAPLPGVNSADGCCLETFPSVNPDNTEIVFHSNSPATGLGGAARIWRAYRSSGSLDFGNRAPIDALKNISAYYPIFTHDGSAVYFGNLTTKAVMRSARITGATFATPAVVVTDGAFPVVNGDETVLYFQRAGEIRVATKDASGFTVGPVQAELAGYVPSWLSADGCTITLFGAQVANGKTGANIWTASKP